MADGNNIEEAGRCVEQDISALKRDGQASDSRPTDLELVRSTARGDARAFHALVDRHAQELFQLAVALSRGRADAEDVVQETLLGAYQGLSKFDGRSSVKTWLKRILVRQAARAWNRSRRSLHALPIEAAEEVRPIGRAGSAGSPTASVDRRLDVATALRTLSREHREVIALREFQQLSYAEMADVLGVPQGTIESRLHRARAELKTRLDAYDT